MSSRFIIIAILIFVKVIGVASRTRAENYLPGYTCDDSVIYRVNCPEHQNYFSKKVSYNFWKPTYRCGKSTTITMGSLRG